MFILDTNQLEIALWHAEQKAAGGRSRTGKSPGEVIFNNYTCIA